MSDLTGCAVGACKDLSAQNDAAADTCSESDHDNIVVALAAAVPLLAESSYVGIISDFHIDAVQKGGELFADIDHVPSEVDAFVYDSVGKNGAGNADAYTLEIIEREFTLFEFLFNRARNIGENHFAIVFRARGDLPVVDELAV